MLKRCLLLLFLFLCLFAADVAATTYQGGNQLVNENNWEQYKRTEKLMSNLRYSISDSKGNQHYFNRELWEKQSLIVYGDYRSIYPNDFKHGTQNPTGVAYYYGGEYRYHGYSQDGSKFNNLEFIDDAVGNNNLFIRNWLYQPWKAGSVGLLSFRQFIGESPSIYNLTALNSSSTVEGKLVAKWINQSVDFIRKGTRTGGDLVSNLDPVNYLNIDSVPSAYSSGQGTMFHFSENGKVYYQSFPISRYQKEPTTISASIEDIATVAISGTGDITLEILVNAHINDESYINNPILESIYYTRKDIQEWNFTLKNNLLSGSISAQGLTREGNQVGYYIFQLQLAKDDYQNFLDNDNGFVVNFLLDAEVVYATEDTDRASAVAEKRITGTIDSELIVKADKKVNFYVSAPTQMLDVERFALQLWEYDVSAVIQRYVEINGNRLTLHDEMQFLSGNYQFPQIGEDRVYNYSVNYLDKTGEHFFYISSVIVYDSLPHAQIRVGGTFKENRKISITADETISSGYLRSRTPITISQFKITSVDGEPLYYGMNASRHKEFLSKKAGEVTVELVVENQYGRREYKFNLYISPDYAPDIVAYVWKNLLARGEGLDLICDATSLDGDRIAQLSYEIYYLSESGKAELVAGGLYDEHFAYMPSQLGNYKIVFTATEEFGETSIDQYISASDYRQTVLERNFFVDNLVPVTKLYTDIEAILPSVELIILLDEGLDDATRGQLKESRIEVINNFRLNGINAIIEFWDLKAYLTEQTAYKTLATGTQFPPATYQYSENGYSGILNRTSVNNYSYTDDYGSYQTFSDSFTATSTGSGYSYSVYYKGVWQYGYNTDTPSIQYYDSNGYSGYLYKDSAWISGKESVTSGDYRYVTVYYTASYSGVVSRTWQEWVPYYVTINDYYGNYAGKVTKVVKQVYTANVIDKSSKYLVYFTANKVNNLTDYQKLRAKLPEARTVLIGSGTSFNQLSTDYYLENNNDTANTIGRVISLVRNEQAIDPRLAVLLGEKFELKFSDIDYEGDPIVESGLQYVHNLKYLDNTLRLEPGAREEYSENGYTSKVKNAFTEPGLFTIYRRVKDEPIGQEKYGGYSNVANLEIIAHRKPVADIYVVADYDYSRKIYNISWLDFSYDPDFQFSRKDKGVIKSNFKYKSTTTDWVYGKPSQLAPGEYQFEYIVMDCFGVWSEPFQRSFKLATAPQQPAIGVTGYVKHTDKWNYNREQFNLARGGTSNYPMSESQFFAGEGLVLEAVTRGEPERVYVEILGTNLSTHLQLQGGNLWEGALWNREMMSWHGRFITVRFYALKMNTPIIYHDVVIEIVGEDFWRQHRLY